MEMISRNKYLILVFIIIGLVVGFVWLKMASAHQEIIVEKAYVCHKDGRSGNYNTLYLPLVAVNFHLQHHNDDYAGQCEEEEVTPTPTDTPKDYCDTVEGVQEEDEDCPEVTPTPEEPTPTPNEPRVTPTEEVKVGNPAQGEGKHNEVVCNGVVIDAPELQGFQVDSDTSVTWKWWKSTTEGIQYQVIEYGYEKGNYPYSVIVDKDVSAYAIGSLEKGKVRWARVGAFKDGCSAFSNDLDP